MLANKRINIKYRILVLIILATLFFTSNLYGENTMRPLYTLNRALMKKLLPEIYPTKKNEIVGIFDFPVDNAIATNMLPGTNAVTLISFDEKKLKVKYKTIAKNFKDYVGGGETSYLPIFSEDIIGYSQTRGFNLLNIRTKKNNYYSIVGDTNYEIMDNIVINSENKIFLFDIDIMKSEVTQSLLRIMDLSRKKAQIISEKIIYGNIYIKNSESTIFFLNDNEIKATDINLKEVDHPFVQIFNKEKDRFKEITELIIHPNLPFAVFNDDEKEEMWMISWREDDIKNDKFLIKILGSESYSYQLSYDGKWLQFDNFKEFIIMPVNPDLPYFLGKPILLGEIPRYPSGKGVTAMTRNPSGFVITERQRDGLKKINILKKWDFTEAEKLIEKPE